MVSCIIVAAILAVLWLAFFCVLRNAAYGFRAAFSISLISAAQAGLLLSAATGGSGLWFALAIAATATSAIAFAAHPHDARFIAALGGSLGAIQLADPSGGIVAALALPMLAGLQRERIAQTGGLLVLLLFIPCLFAAGLAYAAAHGHIYVAQWLSQFSRTGLIVWPPVAGGAGFSVASFLFFLPALPVFVPALMKGPSKQLWALAAAAAAVIAAAFVAMLLRISRNPVEFIAALAPIAPAALSLLPAEPARENRALLASLASTIVSWAVACGAFITVG